ncbi:hypothetical protein FCX65_25005 [Escherichia coli]|nr:hypothetical protein [Escherichia coli]
MSRTRLLPRLENLPGLTNLRKTTLPGGFFVFRARDYAHQKRISRRSCSKSAANVNFISLNLTNPTPLGSKVKV